MHKFSLCVVFLVFVSASGWVINNVDFDKLEERSVNLALDNNDNSLVDDDILIPEERISLIYPGTKWCGAGNIADNFDDLGPWKETDKCCRDHDYCPDIISGGEMKHNLTNNAFYTRLNCNCDEKFRQCLHASNATSARQIGKIYFNVIGTKCFREDYPITGCKKKGGWLRRKCLEYEYDTTKEKRYQWFDVPNYS